MVFESYSFFKLAPTYKTCIVGFSFPRKLSHWKRKKKLWRIDSRRNQRCINREAQQDAFTNEYCQLLKDKPVKSDSKLISLKPLIGKDGLLRCNGRLRYTEFLAYDERYPADVSDEEFMTAIIEAESLLNSRPFTYSTANVDDDVPLTTSHFLHGQMGGRFAPDAVDPTTFSPQKRW